MKDRTNAQPHYTACATLYSHINQAINLSCSKLRLNKRTCVISWHMVAFMWKKVSTLTDIFIDGSRESQ